MYQIGQQLFYVDWLGGCNYEILSGKYIGRNGNGLFLVMLEDGSEKSTAGLNLYQTEKEAVDYVVKAYNLGINKRTQDIREIQGRLDKIKILPWAKENCFIIRKIGAFNFEVVACDCIKFIAYRLQYYVECKDGSKGYVSPDEIAGIFDTKEEAHKRIHSLFDEQVSNSVRRSAIMDIQKG